MNATLRALLLSRVSRCLLRRDVLLCLGLLSSVAAPASADAGKAAAMHYMKAVLLEHQGNVLEALQEYQAAIALDPQSTFLVEMSETAYILRHATRRSLAVLDEIGRGTSTYDGVSIAWAVAEALAVSTGCRTLFATHYHELAALAQEHPAAVANACVAVREEAGGIAFLHRIQAGSADRSYGLHVAALAGVPSEVTRRAKGILAVLEGQGLELVVRMEGSKPAPTLFPEPPDPLRERLKALSPERMTPLEALNLLTELKKSLGDA